MLTRGPGFIAAAENCMPKLSASHGVSGIASLVVLSMSVVSVR